jgi:phosphohistidine phosphatase
MAHAYRAAVAHTLLLVRHAKAMSDGATDAERQLAPRGIRDAGAAGRWLVDRGLAPEHVVVSPAHRAMQTWQLMAAELAAAPPPTIDRRVYDNTLDAVLAVLQETAEDTGSLAIVGHNPSMQELVAALDDGHGDDGARAGITQGFPTAGIAVLDIGVGWAALMPGAATLREFAAARG